jgi:hypothetical protein
VYHAYKHNNEKRLRQHVDLDVQNGAWYKKYNNECQHDNMYFDVYNFAFTKKDVIKNLLREMNTDIEFNMEYYHMTYEEAINADSVIKDKKEFWKNYKLRITK